jgi:hypothetical protein
MRFATFFVAVTWLLAAAGGAETDVGESFAGDDRCSSCPTDCISGSPRGCDPSRFWVRGEYLMWWTKGMYVPPLVTTSPQGTSDDDAGVLGRPDTRILFGDEGLFDQVRWGTRLQVGAWLGDCQCYGVEGEYFALGDETVRFQRQSNGDPILARPFFNVLSEEQDSELVAYPDLIEGTVTVGALTELESAGVRARINLRSACCCAVSGCGECSPSAARVDLLLGYRFLHLDEDLWVREDLNSLLPVAPAAFQINDRFDSENAFHGGEIGLLLESQGCRWSWEILAKVALGNSHEVVRIDGDTAITLYGVPSPYPAGILAQRTNIGEYADDEFAVVPEVGITVGYQLTCRLRATFGYSFIYWNDVARPGEQIDLGLNPNLFPPEQVPFSGPLRPAFAFQHTDYWAQGLRFGVDYRW